MWTPDLFTTKVGSLVLKEVPVVMDKESVDPGAGATGASSDQGLATPVARGGHA